MIPEIYKITANMSKALLTGEIALLEKACAESKCSVELMIEASKLNAIQAKKVRNLYNSIETIYINAFTDIYVLHKDSNKVLTEALLSIKLED